jgi:hypothetical protein
LSSKGLPQRPPDSEQWATRPHSVHWDSAEDQRYSKSSARPGSENPHRCGAWCRGFKSFACPSSSFSQISSIMFNHCWVFAPLPVKAGIQRIIMTPNDQNCRVTQQKHTNRVTGSSPCRTTWPVASSGQQSHVHNRKLQFPMHFSLDPATIKLTMQPITHHQRCFQQTCSAHLNFFAWMADRQKIYTGVVFGPQ